MAEEVFSWDFVFFLSLVPVQFREPGNWRKLCWWTCERRLFIHPYLWEKAALQCDVFHPTKGGSREWTNLKWGKGKVVILIMKTNLFNEDCDKFGLMGLCILPDSLLVAVSHWKIIFTNRFENGSGFPLTSQFNPLRRVEHKSKVCSKPAAPRILLHLYPGHQYGLHSAQSTAIFCISYFIEVKSGVSSFPRTRSREPDCVGVTIPRILRSVHFKTIQDEKEEHIRTQK